MNERKEDEAEKSLGSGNPRKKEQQVRTKKKVIYTYL
jgi:hypothetical protein